MGRRRCRAIPTLNQSADETHTPTSRCLPSTLARTQEEEEEEECITSGNWRGKHNSLSHGAGADQPYGHNSGQSQTNSESYVALLNLRLEVKQGTLETRGWLAGWPYLVQPAQPGPHHTEKGLLPTPRVPWSFTSLRPLASSPMPSCFPGPVQPWTKQ